MKKLLIGGLLAASFVVVPQTASASIIGDFFGTLFGGGKVTTQSAQTASPAVSNISITKGAPIFLRNTIAAQPFTLKYSISAANDPIYISTRADIAVSKLVNLNGGAIAATSFTDNDTSGDIPNYFYIAPGQTKNFTIEYLTYAASSTTAVTDPTIVPRGVTYGTAINNSTTGSSTQQFTFTFDVTAGSNPMYLSWNAYHTLATSTNPSGMTITSINLSDDNPAGDTINGFYIAPGQTKKFTAVYQASGLTSNGGTVQVNAIKYKTAQYSLKDEYVTNSNVPNSLKALLYH